MRQLVIVVAAFISGVNFWNLKTKTRKSAMDSWHYWINLICLLAIQFAWAVLEV